MKPLRILLLPVVLAAFVQVAPSFADPVEELDAFWAELSRTVVEGDFEAYAAIYHADAVLVSGFSNNSYPIAQALDDWKQGFEDTRDGRMQASVEFRFTQRLHDETTAHETGIYRYSAQMEGQETSVYTVHFHCRLVKNNGRWLMMMEHQIGPATDEEWEAAGLTSARR